MTGTSLTQTDIWNLLNAHHKDIKDQHMRDWFAQDNNRFERFQLDAAGINLDYSKNRVTSDTMALLHKLAHERGLPEQIDSMFRGEVMNRSEKRPVLHTALRNFSDRQIMVDGTDVMPEIRHTMQRMEEFCWKIRRNQWRGFNNQPFTDVVSIGIGGSFLGPKLASSSLKPYWDSGLSIHYLANIDGTHITEILKRLNPATTLFIIQSKSFGNSGDLKERSGLP